MTITIADARQEADEAARQVRQLEQQAVQAPPEQRPAAAEIAAARVHAQLAQQRIEHAQRLAEQAAAQARLDALTGLGAEVDALAAEASSSPAISGAVNALKLAADQLRAAATEHDAQVAGLRKRIGAWDPKPSRTAPHGPAAADAWVGLTPAGWGRAQGGVRHQDTAVTAVSEGVGRAIELACAGDVKAALAAVATVVSTAPQPMAGYVRDTLTGDVLPWRGQIPRSYLSMIESGRGVRLTAEQAAAYQEGKS